MIVRSLITRLGFRVDNRNVNRYIISVKGMVNVTDQLSRSVSRVSTLFRPFLRNIGFANIGIIALGTGILKLGGQAEQSRIAFNTLTDSVEKGTKLYEDLIQFAEKTPFRVTGLLESSKRLLAFGFKANEVVGTLTTLGNIASGVGIDKLPFLIKALGDVRTNTRLYSREVLQFTNAGVDLKKALSEVLDIDIKKLAKEIERGRVSYEDVLKALRFLEKTRFSGLLVKQNKTLLGQFERLVDVIQNISREIGEALGPGVKEVIIVIRKYVNLNRDLIKQNTLKFFKQFIILVGGVALAFFKMVQRLGGFGKAISFIVDKMKLTNESISKFEDFLSPFNAILSAARDFAVAVYNIVISLGDLPVIIFSIEKRFSSLFKSIKEDFNKYIQPIVDITEKFLSEPAVKAFSNIFSFKGASAEGIKRTRESLKKFETGSLWEDVKNTVKSGLTTLGFKGYEDPRMSNNVSVKPTINITTPAGTTQQQSDFLKKQFEDYATPKLENVFKKAINDLRPVEAQ